YIEGEMVGTAENIGKGGPTDINTKDKKGAELIRRAEVYCRTLPPTEFEFDGKKYSLPTTLDSIVDDLVSKDLEEKARKAFDRKVRKRMPYSIIYGTKDSVIAQKLKMPIRRLLNLPNGDVLLSNLIATYIHPKLKEGEKVLNTN